MNIITLCGSTKFKKQFESVNAYLTLQGHIVLSVGVFPHAGHEVITSEQKHLLDKLHFKKIDMANEIFVIDVDGYVGESTRKEIEYAINKKKPIHFYSKSTFITTPAFKQLEKN
ncbi:hypothetical protein [Brevibacillus sp. HD1.4A]|uniref:hypothetical protein n=1 Tax=Brevibacillus sp. HD1.4A TaxID=2738978 RepID=UPI00156B4FE1|nr:hypothetical protein [Brevibacillus sp. HD1.4A]NRQ56327.1 hypothetical protein [Brevibacillus sp. HD1.4A]